MGGSYPFTDHTWEQDGNGYSLMSVGFPQNAGMQTTGSATLTSIAGQPIGCAGACVQTRWHGDVPPTLPAVIISFPAGLAQNFFTSVTITKNGGTPTVFTSASAQFNPVEDGSPPANDLTIWSWHVTNDADYFVNGVSTTLVFDFTTLATVPNVVGDTLSAATSAITGASLVLGTVTSILAGSHTVGTIAAQNPAAGSMVTAGSSVDVTEYVAAATVPDVTSLLLATAESDITGAGLTVGTITSVFGFPDGTISSQNPAPGTSVLPGTAVNLVEFQTGVTGVIPAFLNDELILGGYFGGKLNMVEFVYVPGRTPFLQGATNLILNRYKQEPTDSRQRGVDYTYFVVPGEVVTNVVIVGISAQGVLQEDTLPLVTPVVVTNVVIDPAGLKFAYTLTGGQNGIEYTVQFRTTTTLQTSNVEEIFSINFLIEDGFP